LLAARRLRWCLRSVLRFETESRSCMSSRIWRVHSVLELTSLRHPWRYPRNCLNKIKKCPLRNDTVCLGLFFVSSKIEGGWGVKADRGLRHGVRSPGTPPVHSHGLEEGCVFCVVFLAPPKSRRRVVPFFSPLDRVRGLQVRCSIREELHRS